MSLLSEDELVNLWGLQNYHSFNPRIRDFAYKVRDAQHAKGQEEMTAYYAEMMEKALDRVRQEKNKDCQKRIEQVEKEAWELQDTLLDLTILNQNAPKIVLTNDECGWDITYYPDPPYTTGEIGLMEGNPLEAVRALKQKLAKIKEG